MKSYPEVLALLLAMKDGEMAAWLWLMEGEKVFFFSFLLSSEHCHWLVMHHSSWVTSIASWLFMIKSINHTWCREQVIISRQSTCETRCEGLRGTLYRHGHRGGNEIWHQRQRLHNISQDLMAYLIKYSTAHYTVKHNCKPLQSTDCCSILLTVKEKKKKKKSTNQAHRWLDSNQLHVVTFIHKQAELQKFVTSQNKCLKNTVKAFPQ